MNELDRFLAFHRDDCDMVLYNHSCSCGRNKAVAELSQLWTALDEARVVNNNVLLDPDDGRASAIIWRRRWAGLITARYTKPDENGAHEDARAWLEEHPEVKP
jgi:hypothetical protein